LLAAGRVDEAAGFYRSMLELRPLPWARFGLSRALQQQGRVDECKEALGSLIQESPQFLAAYDLLGKVHLAAGDADAALGVLDSACAISPNSLARHRAVATVAEDKGDYRRVEAALAKVVGKTRNTPLRETADIARLGLAYTENGEPAKAVGLIEEACKNFKADLGDVHLAAVEAMAQRKAGNADKAEAALVRVMQGDSGKLLPAAAMVVAKACLGAGKQDVAHGILKNLVQTHPEARQLHDRVSSVLRESGAGKAAESLVAESISEIIHLNNEAVRKAKAGEVALAAEMLTSAARRLPGNIQIVANAAAALLFDVLSNGLDAEKLQQAQSFQRLVQAREPAHPKLAEIAQLVAQIRGKYAATAK
jgi:tetratricopeptide (TPR) repeat protein